MNTFSMRLIRSLFTFLFITSPLELIGIPLLAVVLLFIKKDAVQLPRLFKYWDNHESYFMRHDDPELDGLSGPLYYITREGLDLSSYWGRYRARLNWLAIRNPLNYFQYVILGAAILPTTQILTTTTPEALADIDKTGGLEYSRTLDGKYYEYYRIIPYKLWKGRALRLRFGHKISSKYRPIQQFVFVINPFFTLG